MQKGLRRKWSFSGLATMVRITLMYYVDLNSLFNNPEKDWEMILESASGAPPEPHFLTKGACQRKETDSIAVNQQPCLAFLPLPCFIGQQ